MSKIDGTEWAMCRDVQGGFVGDMHIRSAHGRGGVVFANFGGLSKPELMILPNMHTRIIPEDCY